MALCYFAYAFTLARSRRSGRSTSSEEGASVEKVFSEGVKNTDVFPAAYMDVLAAAPEKTFLTDAPDGNPEREC